MRALPAARASATCAIATCLFMSFGLGSEPPFAAGAAAAAAPLTTASAGASAAPAPAAPFAPLDLPEWAIVHAGAAPKDRPWILIVDDPQCPYCMQLLLAIEKARETGDAEILGATVVTLPYPLAYHDQSAHILADAFCLEASRARRSWGAGPYLDWLMVEGWKQEPGWKSATLEDLGKDGGFFDTHYESRRVTSSRRREYQTGFAKTESDCGPRSCAGDVDCEKLCADESACRAACPAPAAGAAAPGAAPGAAAASPDRDKCLADCSSSFVSRRYRQFSKIHAACLLEEGPGSAHAKVAAAYAWAVQHKVPGTPTVYAGAPSIGFRTLGDSDDLAGAMTLLRKTLAEARSKLSAAAGGT